MGITSDIIVIVLAAMVGGILAQRLKQSLILGYIVAGILLGPYDLGFVVKDGENGIAGNSIRSLGIRSKTVASVVGVMRHGILYPQPDPEFAFIAGDMVAVIGRPQECLAFEELAGAGKVAHGTIPRQPDGEPAT